jgi:hypothetical protein
VTTPLEEFLALDLRCHTLLGDAPLHDVWAIDLAGGGPDRTMADVDAVANPGRLGTPPPVVRALFAVRAAVGRALGWDRPRHEHAETSYARRLDDADLARSQVKPGARRGIFRLLYLFEHEALAETRNATVHAFLAMALRPREGGGYRLYWGIYVKPVGRLTRVYMALIDPFRRAFVYPALIRQTQTAWARAYGAAA